MTTIARGNAAEAAVLLALESVGLPTMLPFGGGMPFDLAALLPDDHLLRIQVKCARIRNNCVQFNTCSTDHGRGRQHYRGRADVIAVYEPSLATVFMIPVEDCPDYVGTLRIEPTRNNQRRGIRMAEDYTFDNWVQQVADEAAFL